MRRTFVIAVAVSMVIAGCGGGGSSKTESASSLKSKANAICAKVNKDTNAASKSNDFDKALGATKDAIKKLKALKAPDDLKAGYAAFTAKLDASVGPLTKLVDAVKAKDVKAATDLSGSVDKLDAQIDAQALKLGLTECAMDT